MSTGEFVTHIERTLAEAKRLIAEGMPINDIVTKLIELGKEISNG